MQNKEILTSLKKRGYRITRARKAILSVLKDSKRPQDVPTILEKLEKKGIAVNKTTVYREIQFLEENSITESCGVDGIKKEYRLKSGTTPQAHCMQCNQFVSVCSDFERELENFKKKLKAKNHFTIDTSKIHLHGTCKNCQW